MKSDWKRSEGKAGSFKHTAGKWSGDPDDKGVDFYLFSLFIVGYESDEDRLYVLVGKLDRIDEFHNHVLLMIYCRLFHKGGIHVK